MRQVPTAACSCWRQCQSSPKNPCLPLHGLLAPSPHGVQPTTHPRRSGTRAASWPGRRPGGQRGNTEGRRGRFRPGIDHTQARTAVARMRAQATLGAHLYRRDKLQQSQTQGPNEDSCRTSVTPGTQHQQALVHSAPAPLAPARCRCAAPPRAPRQRRRPAPRTPRSGTPGAGQGAAAVRAPLHAENRARGMEGSRLNSAG